MVAQLTLALILLYLHNIRKMMQLDSYQLRRSESFDHVPHPVYLRRKFDKDAREFGAKSPELLLTVSNAGQSNVVRCPSTLRPNSTLGTKWQRQDYSSGIIYIYSAVYDSRPPARRHPDSGTVRVLVLASGLQGHTTPVYCQMWYSEVSEAPLVVRADLIELDTDVGQLKIGHQVYVQYLVSCLLHQSAAAINVEAVSVAVRDGCASASALVPVYHPAAVTTETSIGIGICAVMAWPVSDESSGALRLQSAPWLVEWMELQLSVFGASRVFLYVAFDDDLRSLERLIRFYAADVRKSLVVRRIPHPVAAGRKRHQQQETIGKLRALAVNDCMLRGASQFRYLIDVDFDELLVPRHVAQNYSDLIARISSSVAEKRPQFHDTPAIYFFHVLSFHVDSPIDDSAPQSSRFTTTGRLRSRDRPEKKARRVMIDCSRCVVVSLSTGCDVTTMAVKNRGVDVPLNVAACHRYRRACVSSDVGCRTPPIRHLQSPVKDNTMLRFQPRLKFSLIQALKDSGTVDKAGLYQVALNA